MLREVTAQTIENGFRLGGLVDLSEFAPKSCSKRIAATAALWQSILRPYPTAQQSDFIDPAELVRSLDADIPSLFSSQVGPLMLFAYGPSQRPEWLPKDFTISVYSHPVAILLKLKGEKSAAELPQSEVVPASLFFRIAQVFILLLNVARTNDRLLLRELRTQLRSLCKDHPLQEQLDSALQDYAPVLPTHLTREEYRTLLIRELGKLLEIGFACGIKSGVARELSQTYDKLCSPINELVYLVRTLVELCAAVPDSLARHSPFEHLMNAYVAVRPLSNQSGTTVPQRFFDCLSTDALVLSQLLPNTYAEELGDLQQRLAVLQSLSGTFAMGATYPPKFHIYH